MNEVERIIRAYRRYDRSGVRQKRYSLSDQAYFFSVKQREKEILKALLETGHGNFAEQHILDVGCGEGRVLRDFVQYGARANNCYGIDLLPDRIATAAKCSDAMNLVCGNAEQIPWGAASFDIVLCFTLFSSIFDQNMKKAIAREILRVCKPDGIILFYDLRCPNPGNPDVRKITRKEVYDFFPGCDLVLKRITPAQPLTRMLAGLSSKLCQLLHETSFLSTHFFVVIQRRSCREE